MAPVFTFPIRHSRPRLEKEMVNRGRRLLDGPVKAVMSYKYVPYIGTDYWTTRAVPRDPKTGHYRYPSRRKPDFGHYKYRGREKFIVYIAHIICRPDARTYIKGNSNRGLYNIITAGFAPTVPKVKINILKVKQPAAR